MNYYNIKYVNVLSIIIILLLCSCSTEESTIPIFSVDIVADSFVSEGGDKTITLTSNTPWSASTSEDWLTVTPTKGTGGTTITMSATENNTPSMRKGVVTLTPEIGEPIKVSVSQATRYQFQVDIMELTFPPVSGTLELSLTSKTTWRVASSADWLTVSPDNGQSSSTLTFTASSNMSRDERKTTVTLIPDMGEDIEIMVIQDGVILSTDVSEFSFSDSPGKKSITLMSNVSWEFVSDADWLNIDSVEVVDTDTDNDIKEELINLVVRRNVATEARSATITLTPEIGEPIAITVLQEGTDYVSESIKYVATNAKGTGTGDTEANAADFLSSEFWKQINNELENKSVEVKFLPGSYLRAYTDSGNNGLYLLEIGDKNNQLIISGGEEVMFPVPGGYRIKGNLILLNSCQNIIFRDFNFTGNGEINYVLGIRSTSGYPASQNITIENCTWIDMLGVVYGATGCHYERTSNIIYKNCTFKRIGLNSGSHMIYNAHLSSNISIIGCHFEDCMGDYVRFRDRSDFGLVKNSVFIRNNDFPVASFIALPLFNTTDPGNEYFATNYSFTNNAFINNAFSNTPHAIRFSHRGYSPKEFKYLPTREEGNILQNGTKSEKAEQFIENFGIDLDKIRITDNTYSDRINNQVSLYTYTAYGSTSMGWRGTLYLTSLVNNSTIPFDWEEF